LIYEFPGAEDPIRQGDIFSALPRVEVSLGSITVVEDEGSRETSWPDLDGLTTPIVAAFPLKPVPAIVITQDCDAVRAVDISLCEIKLFRAVEGKARQRIIIQHSRQNFKWFYLPPDPMVGFEDKMAVDFSSTIRLPREELESLKSLRRGRLNSTGREHFRHRLGYYFTRYAFDEWYALSDEELAIYETEVGGPVDPHPWQKVRAGTAETPPIVEAQPKLSKLSWLKQQFFGRKR